MTRDSIFRRFRRDEGGAAAIEFALIAPTLIMMLLGVLMIGIHMQAFNAIRSAAYDAERFTVVEYQRENKMLPAQIEQVAIAIATRSPYNFNAEELEACVTMEDSGMTGAAKYNLELSYKPPEISGIFGFASPTITYDQSIIVPGAGVPGICGSEAGGSE